ncbi:MAG: hypothetical protein ACR2JF_17800 [Iamia sp.]
MLDKLQAFAASLDPAERQLLAALVAPGMDAAWSGWAEADPVWAPVQLPAHLVESVGDGAGTAPGPGRESEPPPADEGR